ncbi:MAG TPA: DUF2059 domain-containing protein [Burkholderiaceae bacterium]|nr:DUF2059 domain-containing protein [Burkholderiaceae bacterium]
MMAAYRLTAIALLLLGAAGAHAQNEGKKELVHKLLQLQRPGIEAMARGLAEQPAAQAIQTSRQVLLRVPAEKREAATKAAEAEIKKYLEESVPLVRDKAVQLAPSTIGPVLEDKFSEEELRQLITWIESPLNRKYQQLGPELQNVLSQKLVVEMRPVIDPRLKALDAGLGKALGIAPRPATAPASAPAKGSN